MKKLIENWSIEKMVGKYNQINFPEYQREPNVWGRDAKQRLIDSIVREFDISPLYFYTKDDYLIDCVDGRQRIGAIMSFLGKNEKDTADRGFAFRILNELYEDSENTYEQLNGLGYSEIERRENEGETLAKEFLGAILNYKLTIVMLSDSNTYNEFNLQFARLNLGAIINSGEKLNAMVGDLRNACFDGLGQHQFLEVIRMPERRFSREQTAAQILAQVFSFEKNLQSDQSQEYVRTRHFDLQRLFKEYTDMGADEHKWVDKVKGLLNLLSKVNDQFALVRSRALVVSTVMLAYKLDITNEEDVIDFGKFVDKFAHRLKWQVRKGLDVDPQYRYLIDFQKHMIQGSVEKPAVTARAQVLEDEFNRWKETGKLKGDEEYETTNEKPADAACRSEEERP